MSKKLTTKLANMMLCGTMIINVAGQATPIMAETQGSMDAVIGEVQASERDTNTPEQTAKEESQTDETGKTETVEQEQITEKTEEAAEQEETTEKTEEAAEQEETTEKTEEAAEQEETTEKTEEAVDKEETTEKIEEVVEQEQTTEETVADQESTLEAVTGEEQTQPSKEEESYIQDSWDQQVNEATYHANIKVYKEDKDSQSMAAQFFEQTNLPVEIVDGKVYVTLKVKKDGMGTTDAIGSLEEKEEDGSYTNLELQYLNDSNIRYITTKICFNDIFAKDAVVLRCGIITPFMSMSPSLRIVLTEDTVKELQEVITSQNKVTMSVQKTQETVAGNQDGTITITANGGSGSYEYTIDGGDSWVSENVFSQLGAGTYNVGVKDSNGETQFEEVTIEALKEREEEESENVVLEDGVYKTDLNILHETEDKPSHAASFFKSNEVNLTVKEGKAYLELLVKNNNDMIKGLTQSVKPSEEALAVETVAADEKPLVLEPVTIEGQPYVRTLIAMGDVNETVYVRCHVIVNMGTQVMDKNYMLRIKADVQNATKDEAELVTVQVEKKDVQAENKGSITVTAAGGKGQYEYTTDGGKTWVSQNEFTKLEAGTYQVAARDLQNTGNISAVQEVTILAATNGGNGSGAESTTLQDGLYTANISVLQENSDEASMSAQFFNTKGLPLEIRNQKAYLTIQVLKDGMGMSDIISSLEQKVNGSFKALSLDYLNDSSKRYITTTIELDSVEEDAYIRCGIKALGSVKPILRVRINKSSITEGAGSISPGLGKTDVTISTVTAENGKVTIEFAEDKQLSAADFKAKLYTEGQKDGKDLVLKDFKQEGTKVTFTYEKVKETDKEQVLSIGIICNDTEVKSNTFKVAASNKEEQPAPEAQKTAISIKANATQIKYINGCPDGTFQPNRETTKAEALTMLAALVDANEKQYYTADIDVLQADKDTASMSKQFFKTKGIAIEKAEDGYLVKLEIANEGMGLKDIITSISQKINGQYQALNVTKSADKKTAYVTLKVADLNEAVYLKTGITPLGDVQPELRIVINKDSVKESAFQSKYTDINMWAKNAITTFEKAGVIGDDDGSLFYPTKAITRGELVKIIVLAKGLDTTQTGDVTANDIKGHKYEAYIKAAIKEGYIVGFQDGSFKPDKTLTRAEAVAIINRVIKHDASTHIKMDQSPFKDLKTTHWAYNEIIKVSNIKK